MDKKQSEDAQNSGGVAAESERQSTGLLPCPFCGGSETANCVDDGTFWTRCLKCGATGPETHRYDGEEGDPFTDWNSRVEPSQISSDKPLRSKVETGEFDRW